MMQSFASSKCGPVSLGLQWPLCTFTDKPEKYISNQIKLFK